MSTKIYNAVILPYKSISEIVTEMHKIQSMELENIENELANGLGGLIREGKANAIYAFFEPDMDRSENPAAYPNNTRARHNFIDAAADFIAAESNNPKITIDKTALRNFAKVCRESIPCITSQEISILATMIQELGEYRKLSFLAGPSHTTILKWYRLTDETQKYLWNAYPDFEYQNQTDGPELSELEPEMDKALDEYAKSLTGGKAAELLKSFEEFLYKYDKALSAFYHNDPKDVFTMAIEDAGEWSEDDYESDEILEPNDMVLSVKRALAYEIYRQRSKIWDEALRNRATYEESSLSFDLFSGLLKRPDKILYRAIRKACELAKTGLGKKSSEGIFAFADMYESELLETLQEKAAVVSRATYEQTAWERDTAVEQLREHYHVGLGEAQNPVMAAVESINWNCVVDAVEHLKAGTSAERENLNKVIRVLTALHNASAAGGGCEYFGKVRWCDEDLTNALEEHGIPATERNINMLREQCERHDFTDFMVSAGWDFINSAIGTLDRESKFETEKN